MMNSIIKEHPEFVGKSRDCEESVVKNKNVGYFENENKLKYVQRAHCAKHPMIVIPTRKFIWKGFALQKGSSLTPVLNKMYLISFLVYHFNHLTTIIFQFATYCRR